MRAHNFSAGPATLPEEVLKQAQEELLNWQNSGMSVTEVSHRGKPFVALMEEARQDLRDLMEIPNNYHILFLACPGRAQYAMVPMNILRSKTTADYIKTGLWSKIATDEGKKYCDVNLIVDTESSNYTTVPDASEWELNNDAAYVFYTANETVNGVEFPFIPETGEVPLVCDMTSNILSQPVDVSKFGIIFAGAQKNIAPAGMTVVIVRDDLIGAPLSFTPTVYDYKINVDNDSLYYTPASFSCYMAGLMFKWLKKQGGLGEMAERNHRKSAKFYDFLDHSSFYSNPIDKTYRSRMNVPFILANEDLNEAFLKESQAAHLTHLKGHRMVGGMRASLYNSLPEKAVDALIDFMKDFEKRNG